ncbi:MAG: hypothetical protein IJX99_09710 [Clostridia bacterium]|nr:hypothetical protein [Clostridia bacterium]
MKIKGANLGEFDVEYKLLSEYPFFKDTRQELVKKLEQMYLKFQEDSTKMTVKPFPKQDGKVEISQGMVNHSCSNSIECLRTMSQYGILASEWFGKVESEKEGVFCCFVDRIHSEINSNEKLQSIAKTLNMRTLKAGKDSITLFFDDTNPIMQQLLHLDYFEYEKIKAQSPEKLFEVYSKEEIEMFDQIIEPFSPASKTFHIKGMIPQCDWSAIPGGIPSALINGICTRNMTYDKDYIEELSRLFPNATIFNGDLEIIHEPKKEKDSQTLQELRSKVRSQEEELETLNAEISELTSKESQVRQAIKDLDKDAKTNIGDDDFGEQ